MKIQNAEFITSPAGYGEVCPLFQKTFSLEKPVKEAFLEITALGVYEASLNGEPVGAFRLSPGWTSYRNRLQVQRYDVSALLSRENELTVSVGNGWCAGRLGWGFKQERWTDETALIALLSVTFEDGTTAEIATDESWRCAEGPVRFSELYDGETYDARVVPDFKDPVRLFPYDKNVLIPQEGEEIREIETLPAVAILHTPKGETVVDFGENVAGYVRFRVNGKAGDEACLSHAEVLDKDGNFYTANLRSAKQKIRYICGGGEAVYRPLHTFQGFRYVRLDRWPGEPDPADFTAVVLCSDLKRTGFFECSDPKVNQLYRNVLRSQKGNFIDVPTDCPQRDERLGWTGDAQVFIETATYNYDVLKFYRKWLNDMRIDQHPDGRLPFAIPALPCYDPDDDEPLGVVDDGKKNACGWADAAVICPWRLYVAYGDRDMLEKQFESMKAHVDWIRRSGGDGLRWTAGIHFGDWLATDCPEGERVGPTSIPLIATAYYAYSTSLLIKAGKALGRDMSEYEALYEKIRAAFRESYVAGDRMTSDTQTAYVLALHFDLLDRREPFAERLRELIVQNGNRLTTGFLGTAYLLRTLSECGYDDLAYSLLLQEEFPSWLYAVNQGATSIWEHWDSLRPDGTMWDTSMNSFNHYAYGAVASWMYGVMGGINPVEEEPGYRKILLRPRTDPRIGFVKTSLETKHGVIRSSWEREGEKTVFSFTVPAGTTATIDLGAVREEVGPGEYRYEI